MQNTLLKKKEKCVCNFVKNANTFSTKKRKEKQCFSFIKKKEKLCKNWESHQNQWWKFESNLNHWSINICCFWCGWIQCPSKLRSKFRATSLKTNGIDHIPNVRRDKNGWLRDSCFFSQGSKNKKWNFCFLKMMKKLKKRTIRFAKIRSNWPDSYRICGENETNHYKHFFLKYFKILQTFLKYFKMFWNITKCFEIFKNVLKYSNIFLLTVWMNGNDRDSVWKHISMFSNLYSCVLGTKWWIQIRNLFHFDISNRKFIAFIVLPRINMGK